MTRPSFRPALKRPRRLLTKRLGGALNLSTVRDAVAYRGGYIVCYKLSIVLLSRRSEAMSNLESSNNLVLVPVPAQHLPEVYSLLGSLYGRGIPATWRRANGDEHAGRAE